MTSSGTGRRAAVGAPVVAAVTVGAWYAWLGWDTGYDVDPVTQAVSGPYQVWQVAGCVLTLAAIAVVGALVSPAWMVAPVMTASFTAAWSVGAARSDDSGLWVIGAALVLLGMAAGSTLLAFGARGLARRSHGAAPAPEAKMARQP